MDPLTLIMLAVLAMLVFFMWRNSKKRKEETAKLQDRMVPGAEIMTNFGLFGRLLSIDEENNVAVIETGEGSTIRVHRQTLARVLDETDGVVADDDTQVDVSDADSSVETASETPRTPPKND
jgi:preprotein translocase subunit YajC